MSNMCAADSGSTPNNRAGMSPEPKNPQDNPAQKSPMGTGNRKFGFGGGSATAAASAPAQFGGGFDQATKSGGNAGGTSSQSRFSNVQQPLSSRQQNPAPTTAANESSSDRVQTY